MTGETQNTSLVNRLLSGTGKLLVGVLAIIAIIVAVVVFLGVVVGIPSAVTAYVVVTAYQAGGWMYAIGAQILMGVVFTIVRFILQVFAALLGGQ